MNFKYPHALLMWVRQNKDHFNTAGSPLDMPVALVPQLYELKNQLIGFERDFRGAQRWMANDCAPMQDTSSSNLPLRAASAALRCADLAMPLMPYLQGPVWDTFNDFLHLPAPEAPGCAVYTLFKDATLQKLLKATPDIHLHPETNGLRLIAGYDLTQANAHVTVPSFSPRQGGSRTVQDEVQYLRTCRERAQADVERFLPELQQYVLRTRERNDRERAQAKQAEEQKRGETTRVEQLVRGFYESLSDADRALVQRHTHVVRDVFGKT